MSEQMNAAQTVLILTGLGVWIVAGITIPITIPAAFRWLLAEAYAAFGDRERKRAIREHQRRVAKEAK